MKEGHPPASRRIAERIARDLNGTGDAERKRFTST